eukprot:11024336-Alexandrium_andersonii.AAC.1
MATVWGAGSEWAGLIFCASPYWDPSHSAVSALRRRLLGGGVEPWGCRYLSERSTARFGRHRRVHGGGST